MAKISKVVFALLILLPIEGSLFSQDQLYEAWLQPGGIQTKLNTIKTNLGRSSLVVQPVNLQDSYSAYWLNITEAEAIQIESLPFVMKVQPAFSNLKRDQKNLKAVFVSEAGILLNPDFRKTFLQVASVIPIYVGMDSTGENLGQAGRVYVMDIPDPNIEWEVTQLPFVFGVHDYSSYGGGGSSGLVAWDDWPIRWLIRLMSPTQKSAFVAELMTSGIASNSIDGGCQSFMCPWFDAASAFLEVNLTRAQAASIMIDPRVLSAFAKTPVPSAASEFREYASLTQNENFQRSVGGANAMSIFANPNYRTEIPPRYVGTNFGSGLNISVFDWDTFSSGNRMTMALPAGADPLNYSQPFAPHSFYRNAFYLGRVPFVSGQNSTSAQIIHATRVSGLILNSTTPYASDSTGVLPGARSLFSSVYFAGSDVAYRGLVSNLLQHQQTAIQNRSFGTPNANATGYATLAAFLDQVVFEYDLNIVQSYGNNNNLIPNGEALAKNVISVGGVRKGPTGSSPLLSKSDDVIHGGLGAPSYGPTPDQRMKPDLVHYSDGLSTGNSVVPNPGSYLSTMLYPTSNTIYAIESPTTLNGTSATAAVVTGYMGIILEMWRNKIFTPTTQRSTDAFLARPKTATMRALLINLADSFDLENDSNRTTHAEIPRARQGWGMPEVSSINTKAEFFIVDEKDILKEATPRKKYLVCSNGKSELRITMAYTDVPGTIAYNTTSPIRINDLDLEVTDPRKIRYLGNSGLDVSRYSRPAVVGEVADSRNSIENIFIRTPVAGKYEISVSIKAGHLAADGIPETPANLPWDASFGLVVSGTVSCNKVPRTDDTRINIFQRVVEK